MAAPRRPGGGGAGDRAGVADRWRVAVAFVVLLATVGAVTALASRALLLGRLEQRIESALGQEVAEVNRFLLISAEPGGGQQLDDLGTAFDLYLARNVPSTDEAFVAFVDGRTYGSALARFPLDRIPPEVVARFGSGDPLAVPPDDVTGRFDSELGPGYYRALPVQLGATSGTFVVMILPTAQLTEVRELQVIGTAAVLLVLVAASGVGRLLLRRLRGPVELLTDTARQISRADLDHRIEVRGTGEAADMARTFNAMLDRLEAVFRSEREFVRDASHELRVPLTVCMGNLDVLALGLPPDDDRAATIALVTDELGRMARIVDDLRLLADAGHGDFLQPEAIDLPTLHADLLAKARALGERRWVAEGSATGTVHADRYRLTEAVMNLVDNAVQHTAAGDLVALGLAADGGEVRLWVRDVGPGVPPQDQARIFDRFRRGASAYRTYRGSGLGLSIVRAIADAHGGRVELVSEPPSGAQFTLVLPRNQPDKRLASE